MFQPVKRLLGCFNLSGTLLTVVPGPTKDGVLQWTVLFLRKLSPEGVTLWNTS